MACFLPKCSISFKTLLYIVFEVDWDPYEKGIQSTTIIFKETFVVGFVVL
jgi:hypothetical protein